MSNNILTLKNFLAREVKDPNYLELNDNIFQEALLDFSRRNNECWVSDTEMDVRKMNKDSCIIRFTHNFAVNIKDIFYNLSAKNQKVFWDLFCMIIGRSVEKMEYDRRQNLINFATQFSNDLKNVNIMLDVDQVINMVINNKDRAQLRLLSMIEPKIEIPQSDQEHFWKHYDNVYKCLYPYEPLNASPNIGLDTCLENLSGLDPSSISSPEDVIKTILNPEMIQSVMNIMQDPQRLNEMVSGIMPIIKNGFPNNFNL